MNFVEAAPLVMTQGSRSPEQVPGQGHPEQVRKNALAYLWRTKISKKRPFSASSEILNFVIFENRTIIRNEVKTG